MSETIRPFGVGIHELLRYAIPGYSSLLVFYLPLITTGTLMSTNWEQFIPFFLVAGLVIGYFIYYPYYFFYRWPFNKKQNRDSLKTTMKLMERSSVVTEVRAVHDIALSIETGDIKDRCRFLFSVFHSIGTLLFAIWGGSLCSVLYIIWNLTSLGIGLLIWECIIILLFVCLSYFLWDEYKYRRDLAFKIEDIIIESHLDNVVTKWLNQVEKGEHVCITVEKELVEWIDEQVKTPRYQNRNHLAKVALKEFQERQQQEKKE